MKSQTKILAEGLCFAEGPRWHDGALWFSDMHAGQVFRLRPNGQPQSVLSIRHRPSGLGWLPEGDLLVVSMTDRRVLRWDGAKLSTHADLKQLADWHCNDMLVDDEGWAWVGNFGFDLESGDAPAATGLIRIAPDGTAERVVEDLMFPNGMALIDGGRTLVVAETFAGRLTAFSIDGNKNLSDRSLWAQLPEGAVPDGICADAEGAIWSASPTSNECIRQTRGGKVTDRIKVARGAYACALHESDLYILTATGSDPETCRQRKDGRIEVARAPHPAP